MERTGIGSDYEIELEHDYVNASGNEVILELRTGRRRFLVEVKATTAEDVRMTPKQAETANCDSDRFVLCFNPGSSRAPASGARGALRAAAGRRLGHEARKVRTAGADVVLVQPTAEDLVVMGPNPMSRRRRTDIRQA